MTHNVYPDFFPDDCPPIDATSKSIKVFRLIVDEKNISEKDFYSYYELGKKCDEKDVKSYGVSVNPNFEELRIFWRGNPSLKRLFSNIAGGYTAESMGVIKHTPAKSQKNHHTWWLVKGIRPICSFSFEKW